MTPEKELADSCHLYCYYSSSCCRRIIIAAHLKSIPLTFSFPNLKDGQQREEYRSALNPSASVPTLVVTNTGGRKTLVRQSVASLGYFEERFPDRYPLLPPVSEPEQRALVRDFVNIITNDVQPPANSRVAQHVKAIRGELHDQVAFVKSVFRDGLGAYEALLVETRERRKAGFTAGSQVTMADLCLIPAVDQASFYRFELHFSPNIMEVYNTQKQMGAFQAADWRNQPDTPEKYRHKSA